MLLDAALNGEYSFRRDSEKALQAYNEYGFHVEKDYFTPDYCDYLIQQGDQLANAAENNYRPYMMPHKQNEIFFDVMKNPLGVGIIRQMMDGKPAGMQTQFFFCMPKTRGFSLHQDNFYVQADAGNFISTWISLVDTTSKNGGLIVYPGSHKEGDLPVRKLDLSLDPGQDKNANNEETVIPEKYQPYSLALSKGDALFIHGHVVHGSHANTSDKNRYSLLNLYIKDGAIFRSGNSARREALALD